MVGEGDQGGSEQKEERLGCVLQGLQLAMQTIHGIYLTTSKGRDLRNPPGQNTQETKRCRLLPDDHCMLMHDQFYKDASDWWMTTLREKPLLLHTLSFPFNTGIQVVFFVSENGLSFARHRSASRILVQWLAEPFLMLPIKARPHKVFSTNSSPS